jgi:hypothetical protein
VGYQNVKRRIRFWSMSEHFVLPARREIRCEWPASDVWLIGHQSREGT